MFRKLVTFSAFLLAAPILSAADEKTTVDKLHERIVKQAKEATEADMKPYQEAIPRTDVGFEMVPIRGGEFKMGTPDSEKGRKPAEGPQHSVKIDPFWMGKYEVTWDQYRMFMFTQMAKEADNKDEVVDAVSRPTRP